MFPNFLGAVCLSSACGFTYVPSPRLFLKFLNPYFPRLPWPTNPSNFFLSLSSMLSRCFWSIAQLLSSKTDRDNSLYVFCMYVVEYVFRVSCTRAVCFSSLCFVPFLVFVGCVLFSCFSSFFCNNFFVVLMCGSFVSLSQTPLVYPFSLVGKKLNKKKARLRDLNPLKALFPLKCPCFSFLGCLVFLFLRSLKTISSV